MTACFVDLTPRAEGRHGLNEISSRLIGFHRGSSRSPEARPLSRVPLLLQAYCLADIFFHLARKVASTAPSFSISPRSLIESNTRRIGLLATKASTPSLLDDSQASKISSRSCSTQRGTWLEFEHIRFVISVKSIVHTPVDRHRSGSRRKRWYSAFTRFDILRLSFARSVPCFRCWSRPEPTFQRCFHGTERSLTFHTLPRHRSSRRDDRSSGRPGKGRMSLVSHRFISESDVSLCLSTLCLSLSSYKKSSFVISKLWVFMNFWYLQISECTECT